MRSLAVVFITMALVVWLADALTPHEALALALRVGAVMFFVLWLLNVSGAIYLPLRPW